MLRHIHSQKTLNPCIPHIQSDKIHSHICQITSTAIPPYNVMYHDMSWTFPEYRYTDITDSHPTMALTTAGFSDSVFLNLPKALNRLAFLLFRALPLLLTQMLPPFLTCLDPLTSHFRGVKHSTKIFNNLGKIF